MDGTNARLIAYNANATISYFRLETDGIADTLVQRRTTNAQTSRIYNTFTDASNYERAKIGWNTNVLEIGTENAGTGALRNINFIGGNIGIGTTSATQKLTVNGSILVNNTSSFIGIVSSVHGAISNRKLSLDDGTFIDVAGTWFASNGLRYNTSNGHEFKIGTTSSFAIRSTGVGVGTTSPSAALDVAGDIEVNSNVNLNSEATTLATVTKTQVASFPVASFRSGKLIVQAYDSVTGEVQISELLVAHNGTTASATEYGVVFTGTSSIVIYDVDISAGNVRLLAVRTTANSTQYKISETLMVA